MDEIWKDIAGYEGLYQVSNTGKVKSLSKKRFNSNAVIKEKELKYRPTSKVKKSHFSVALFKNGKRKDIQIHRIVALAFIPKVEGKEYINHIDGNPKNNNVSNLEWCTPKENTVHAWKTGLCENSIRSGANHPSSRKVNVFKIDGTFVNQYESINLACKDLNLNQGNASATIIGKRNHNHGYYLKYAD